MDKRSDEELIRQTLEGKLSAFETLVRRYEKMILAHTSRLLKDQDGAQDATQEAFVRAFKNLKKFDFQRKFKPWLYQIATNYCKDFFKKENRLQKIHAGIPSSEETPLERLIHEERINIVQRALAGLPDIYRIPITGFYLLGLSYNGLVKTLQISANTLKTRMRRGKILLRKELAHVYYSY